MLESDFLIEFFLAVPFPSLFGSLTGIVGNKILGILCQHQSGEVVTFPGVFFSINLFIVQG